MPNARVYRNRRAGAVLLVFAAFVVILILSQALSGSQSAGLRAFGIVVAAAIAAYAIRAAGIEVRVAADGIYVRNTFSTRHLRWSEISDVKASRAFTPRGSGPAYNVVFVRPDGSTVRAQAIRKAEDNAAMVAADLAEIAREHAAVPGDQS
jgi:Bacterial PH domain